MELELGLKITKTRDTDHTSADFRIAKDRAGPIFFSTETETMFILTAHLKGFKRQRIKIDINEDGTQIAISGEKHIQEMVMAKWTMHNKPVEVKRFRKVFRIPDGVVLDRIKARFNEEETILSIFMPKSRKGIRGIGIEEVKEEEVHTEISETIQLESEPESEQPPPPLIVPMVEKIDQPRETEIEEITETEEIITPITEIEDAVPAIEIQDRETGNIEPLDIFQPESNTPVSQPMEEKELEPPEIIIPDQKNNEEIPELEIKTSSEEDNCQENIETMEIEPDRALLHQPETQDVEPTQEIQTNETFIEEEEETVEAVVEEEDALAENIPERCSETVTEQVLDSSSSSSSSETSVQELIEDRKLEEVENEIIREEEKEEIDQAQQQTEEEIIEEPDLGFEEEEEEFTVIEDLTRSSSDDGSKGKGRFRFPRRRLVVGSTFIGLLIAIIIQLLRKNKNPAKILNQIRKRTYH